MMNNKEAIERIRDHIRHHKIGVYPHIYIGEALDMAIKALEKQIPRKPIEKHYEENGERPYVKYSCPYCDNSVSVVTENEMSYQNRFCHKCGQKLDWSEDNDK